MEIKLETVRGGGIGGEVIVTGRSAGAVVVVWGGGSGCDGENIKYK